MTGAIVHAATVRCAIVNSQVRVRAIQGAVIGGGGSGVTDHGALTGLADDDHPQYVLAAGDEMTGLLMMTGASAAAFASKVRVAGDTGSRLWVAADGKVGWDALGAAASPSTTLIPWDGSVVSVSQRWMSFVHDEARDFGVLAVQHGKSGGGFPVLVLQAHDGQPSAPTATLSGQALGELAFRGAAAAGAYPGLTPGGVAGWSGATVQSAAVENWSGSGTGGMLTLQTVPRATVGRVASVAIYDQGQVALDPAGLTVPLLITKDFTLPSSRLRVVSQSATERTIVAKAAASQSVPVFEVQDSNGVAVVTVSAAGAVALGAGSTMAGQALVTTDDPRLTDARTPTAHSHTTGDITGLGALATKSAVASSDITDGTIVAADISSTAAIALSQLADISTARILGRTSSGTGPIEQLSQSAVFGFLGTGTPSASTYLRGDGTWATAGGSVATDAIFDAKGDLAVGTGADAASRLAVGSPNGRVLIADSTASTGLAWSSTPDAAAPLAANLQGQGVPGLNLSWGSTGYSATQGHVFCVPMVVSEATSFNAYIARVESAVASSAIDVAVYSTTSWVAGTTMSKVTGTEVAGTSTASAGAKTMTLAAPVTLQPGRYVLAFVSYGGASAPTFWWCNVNAGFQGALITNGTGASLSCWVNAVGASSLSASYSIGASASAPTSTPVFLRRG